MFEMLKNVRVVESALLINGDAVGMILAELGADVVKVEAAARGDYVRDILGLLAPRQSVVHLQVNKGKRSLALDIASQEGRDAFLRLIDTADIFIDGLKAGAHDRLGVGYEVLAARNPRLIYVSHTGYGCHGPYKDIPTHGFQANALAGGMPSRVADNGHVERVRDVQFMGGTEHAGSGVLHGAQYAAIAALSALHRRSITGEGAFIDLASSDAVLAGSWFGYVLSANFDRIRDFAGQDPTARGEWPEGSTRYQLYRTGDDRTVMFCAIEPRFWRRFCDVAGHPELADTIREELAVDFGQDKPWLRDVIGRIFRERTLEQWMDIARQTGIPIGPAPALEEVVDDPHVKARGIVGELDGGALGPFTYVNFPARIGCERQDAPTLAPRHGEHSRAVLRELGLTHGQVEDLIARGIAAEAPAEG